MYKQHYEKFADGTIKNIENEIPFEIPNSWCWCRLKDLGDIVAGGTPDTKNSDYWNGDINWLTPADLSGYKEKYITCGERKISFDGLKHSSAQLIQPQSVLFSSRAPIGYCVINLESITTNQGFKSIDNIDKRMTEYIYYYLKYITPTIVNNASGTTFKEISGTKFGQTLFLLPPLAEQQRIVEKIEELFAQVDKIEEEKQSLLKLIDKAKDKVLDLAMKGKLVKQDPNDEPASILLEKIFEEKKKLAKEGKIKLSKDELLEPKISDDNDYYRQFIEPKLILKYPKVDNWNKLTLNQICTSISTKEYQIKSSEIKSIGEYPVISQGEQFIDGYCETTKYLDKIPCIIFGDHTRVVKYIDFPFVVGADGTKCLYPYINHKFFYFLIKYYSSFIKNRGYARHFSYLSSFIFYIPSSFKIQEQISAQVENLLNKIEQIKDSL